MKSLGVVGGRDFRDYKLMCQTLDALYFDIVVSGGANGADNLAEKYAWEHNKKLKIFPADWNKFGKSAGYKRNITIVENSDGVCAFWDGKSKGTAHTISLCKEQKKPLKIVYY